MSTKFDTRQSLQRSALSMIGSAASEALNSILSKVDAELGKLYEDRNVMLTDGGLITFTGTTVQFTEALNLVINQKISGAVPQIISLGSTTRAFSATGRIMYAVVDRTAGTAIVTADATTMPATTGTNQEVFLIAKRIDAGDGVQRIYFRSGMAMDVGQTVRLGASGTGGEGGSSEPMPGYLWRENSSFDIIPTSTDSKVNTTNATNATYSAGDKMWQLACDKSKTVAVSSGTGFQPNSASSFTVAIGDIVYMTNGARLGQWRKIATVNSQTNWVLDSAFSGGDASVGNTFMVSQAVWTKDLVNVGDATEKTRARDMFAGNVNQIGIDYFDSLTAADTDGDQFNASRVVLSASNSGLVTDVTVPTSNLFSSIYKRRPKPLEILDYTLSVNTEFGAEALYLQTDAAALSGTGFTMTTAALQTGFSQKLDIPHKHYITKLAIKLARTGAPAGNITATLVRDAGGLPLGETIATASVTANTITTGAVLFTDFVLASATEVEAGTYHVVVQGDATYTAAANAGNHIVVNGITSYDFDRFQVYNTATWSEYTATYLSLNVKLYETPYSAGRLFLCFFCNPDNGDVATTANLIGFECSFYTEEQIINGGVLDSAYGFTDATTDQINCAAPTVVSSKTRFVLDWSYTPNVNPGTTQGSVRVSVNGQQAPRYVAGITTDLYFKEVFNATTGSYDTIELHDDLSAFNFSFEAVRSEGTVDTSDQNTGLLSTLYTAVVGNDAQLAAGIATHSLLSLAITDTAAGGFIKILPSATITENITLDKKLTIEGSGHSSNLMGTFTFGSSSDYSMVKSMRINGNVTFNAGADGIFFREIYLANAATMIDSGTGNSKLVIQE